MTPKSGPVLYRCFDATGRLIYIGSTDRLSQRLGEHRKQSWWFPLIARLETEEHPTIESARAAEATAIQEDQPPLQLARYRPRLARPSGRMDRRGSRALRPVARPARSQLQRDATAQASGARRPQVRLAPPTGPTNPDRSGCLFSKKPARTLSSPAARTGSHSEGE